MHGHGETLKKTAYTGTGVPKKQEKMKIQRMKTALKKGFTLIELLVVVAIIAVIGTGIAVTYQHLDEQAKITMEMSDMSGLKKVIKHWSAVRDFDELPNGLDLLVDENGDLAEGLPGHPPFIAASAPDEVIANLAAAGITLGYVHMDGTTPKNDSTFELSGPYGYEVDTTNTIRTLVADATAVSNDAQEVVDDTTGAAHDYDGPDDIEGNADDVDFSFTTTATTSFGPYATLTAWEAEQAEQQAILDAQPADTLAFIPPDQTYPTFLASEVASNIGLSFDDIADPREDYADELAAGKKFYLVAMGIGRFASLYKGRSVRADGPPKSKRYSGDNYYTRYVAVLKVPLAVVGHGSNAPGAFLADVVSPAGYSVAALEDNLAAAKEDAASDF